MHRIPKVKFVHIQLPMHNELIAAAAVETTSVADPSRSLGILAYILRTHTYVSRHFIHGHPRVPACLHMFFLFFIYCLVF